MLANRFRLGLPSKAFTVDMEQEINSVKRVASLDFDVIGFGHGSPLFSEAKSTILNLVKTLESKG